MAVLRQGARIGLAVGLPVTAAVVATALVREALYGYPLALLPLLLAGPLAARRQRLRTALIGAGVAGLVSALVAVASLVIGLKLVGIPQWGLTSAAAASPMPPLPRVMLFPTSALTWPQQDILFFQPVLAVLLALLSVGARPLEDRLRPAAQRILPRSLGRRLTLAFSVLTGLAAVLGWVSFSNMEDMHYQGHRLQLQADVQLHLSRIQAVLDRELVAPASGQALLERAVELDRNLQHLVATDAHPRSNVPPEELRQLVDDLAPFARRLAGTYVAYLGAQGVATPESLAALPALAASAASATGAERGLIDAQVALTEMRAMVDAAAVEMLDVNDLDHHRQLITLMAVIAGASALGLWLGRETARSVTEPLARQYAHLQRVAQGDFSQRVPRQGPEEFERLAEALNGMTADLDRLYTAERDSRAQAEAIAEREREVANAREFWTNTVVHDLKGPLNVVSGYAELLRRGRLDGLTARQQKAVAEMQRATTYLLQLVDNINDSFRLEADAVALTRQAADVEGLLRGAADQSVGIGTPRVQLPDESLPRVWVDERLIQRTLRNLIGNAYKHAGPAAEVRLGGAAHDAGAVRLWVEDDGPGIPAEQREQVFERFFQGDRAGPGSGLGLAFCRLVVERHGGRIWVEDSALGGAQVCLTLPTDQRAAAGVLPAPAETVHA